MSKLLAQQTRTIDGVDFTISTLSLAESRKIFYKIQGLLQLHNLDVEAAGYDPCMLAALTSALKEEDLQACIDAFAPLTSVQEDELVFYLKDKVALDRTFAGRMDLMFEWISACIEVNFKGVIEKMRAAAKRDQEAKAAAREKAQSPSSSPKA
jgi:hypothetical protein